MSVIEKGDTRQLGLEEIIFIFFYFFKFLFYEFTAQFQDLNWKVKYKQVLFLIVH